MELEYLVVLWAVEYYRHYFRFSHFVVLMDYLVLKWLHTSKLSEPKNKEAKLPEETMKKEKEIINLEWLKSLEDYNEYNDYWGEKKLDKYEDWIENGLIYEEDSNEDNDEPNFIPNNLELKELIKTLTIKSNKEHIWSEANNYQELLELKYKIEKGKQRVEKRKEKKIIIDLTLPVPPDIIVTPPPFDISHDLVTSVTWTFLVLS
ncbi:8666_t:CDS:2 [Scutellospora calospora]|uniref:8666_t:CDS:1 n=1 Tax=Scutellospora calospora TaxID=85575 RepID=A0ACA9JVS5_9GLOM|nr:8666_t:CDS:2 [Scutellospora calospora]